MAKSLIRVLVVDDHPIVRRGLCMEINLDSSMQVVGEARDGKEAVTLAGQLKPDVILMDLVMPQMNGVDATAAILANDPQARVLILTSFSEEEQIFAAIRAGALGSILKDKPPEDLLQAIRDLAQDKTHLDTSIARRLVREAREGSPRRPEDALTERELEVLRMVAGGDPYKFIAQKMGVQEATVRTHVSNILSKLGLINRSQLAMYAISHHLISPEK